MSLRIWLPLNGILDNYGLDDAVITNDGCTINNNGKTGKCYSFNNTRIILECASLKNLFSSPTQPFSFSTWIYLNNDETDRVIIFGCFNSTIFINWELYANLKQRLTAGEPSSYTQKNGIQVLPLEEWVHIAVVFDGTKTIFYQNGIESNIVEGAMDKLTTSVTSSVFWLGSDSRTGATRLKGRMNDFRIYDHALSPMEIKQLSQGLILHYLLNRNGWGQENICKGTALGTYQSGTTNSYTNGKFGSSSSGNGTLRITEDNTCPVGKYSWNITGNTSGNKDFGQNKIPYITDQIYTFSFYAKGTGTGQFRVWDHTKSVQLVTQRWQLTSNWKRYSHTFTGTETMENNRCGVLIGVTGNSAINMCGIKLELGDKATPWSPNSTDDLANLLDINTDIEYDCSGYKNHGIKNGDFEYHSDTPKYNVDTDFNSSYIQTDALPLETKTISFWVKFKELQSGNTYRWLFSQPNLGFQIAYSNSGQNFYTYCRKSGSTTGTRFTGLSGIQIGKWYHFVVIRKTGEEDETPNVRELYINGVKQTPNATNSYNTCLRSYLLIGARSDSSKAKDFGKIQMSDFRVYVTELSETDILSLYHNEAYIDNNGNIYGAILRED